jgi:lysophospholipase L1-like esterase
MPRRRSRSPRRRAALDAHARRSIAAARRMAREVLDFRDRALAARARALRAAPVARARAVAVAPRLVRAAGAAGDTGVLIAEGDSWFDYPLHDVLRLLEDQHGYDVRSVAHKGDRVESMAYNKGQFEEFTRALEKLLRDAMVPRAILLSGGGNDIAGDQFAMLLNHAASARPGLSDAVLTGVIDERIADAYVFLLTAFTTLARERTGQIVPILVHGYDHAVPDGRGFIGGWGPFPGPWLEPGFFDKGLIALDDNTRSVARVIDRFNAMLRRVAAMPGFEHVRYLDLRGTLSNGPDYKQWWGNELHPSTRGFAAVADAFAAALAAL